MHKWSGGSADGEPFFLLVDSFADHPRISKKGKVMAQVIPHPSRVLDTEIPLAELRWVTDEEATEMDETPLHFKAPLPSAPPDDHESPSVDIFALKYLDEDESRQVRRMLRKYEAMPNGSLGEMNTVKHHIDLTPNS